MMLPLIRVHVSGSRRCRGQHVGRIDLAPADRGRQFHMVGTGRYHAAAAETLHDTQLRQHVLPAMLAGKRSPEIKAADIAQFLCIK
jgi:hypothetical protein